MQNVARSVRSAQAPVHADDVRLAYVDVRARRRIARRTGAQLISITCRCAEVVERALARELAAEQRPARAPRGPAAA